MGQYSIGVDLGGTNLRAAAVDENGKMLHKTSGSTAERADREALLGGIVESIETLRARLGALELAGVGVGVPGFILMDQGLVVGSANLPYLDNYPVRDEIERLL